MITDGGGYPESGREISLPGGRHAGTRVAGQSCIGWEYVNGTSFSPDKLHEKVKALHARLLQYYEAHLQGEAQLLSKMKPYWEYLLPDADRKIKKAIKKATTMDKYLTAVNQL